MYLEFVKDLFKANEHVCVICGEERTEGFLVKINTQLIAVKTRYGIVIKKDSDITDIFSISADSKCLDSNIDRCANKAGGIDEPQVDSNIRDSRIDEARQNECMDNSICNESLSSEGAPTLQRNNHCKEMTRHESSIYEVPKPQIKVVGHIDLSAIKDKNRKKTVRRISAGNMYEHTSSCRNNVNGEDSAIAERKINALIQKGETRNALSLIEIYLKRPSCVSKFRSSLLLKKAQAYSALSEYESAKTSYETLIKYNESIKSSSNNLSHLYTELARLQNLTGEGKDVVLKSLNNAIHYNPNNSYASSFIEQLSLDNTGDEQLKVDIEEATTTISPMISIDIKEHLFTNNRVIENGGVPTPSIAKSIYEDAKGTKGVDLSERYPIYLEAAKAYSMLPIGSYDTQEYLESVAYYAILKGNSLFLKFKKALNNNISDIETLLRIKDSACSYYVESLSLLSNIKGEHLLTILANYLKMNIAVVCVKNGIQPTISGNFNKVFFNCISSPDAEMNLVVWSTIITIGAASSYAWNELTKIKGGTRGLYGIMASQQERFKIYTILNDININPIQTDLMPGEFLKKSFDNRKSRNIKFREALSNILKERLNIRLLAPLDTLWQNIPNKYIDLLSDTDKESYKVGSMVLHNLLPYSTRQSQIERTNLLYQAQADLEEQIEFINQNTTYYGRTFFSPLYVKWRSSIQRILREKISQTLPQLQVFPDPAYLVLDGENLVANLVVKNIGESTAEGFKMSASLTATETGAKISGKREGQKDIPVGTQFDQKMTLPEVFRGCKTIDVSIYVASIYQGEQTAPINYRFTLEIEPTSTLTEEDILWKDGPKMSGVLFKGRQGLINKLTRHYLSVDRDKPYILYGLTRTGKSSILLNLKNALSGHAISINGAKHELVPIEWDLSEASSFGNARDMWQYLLRDTLYDELEQFAQSKCQTELMISDYPRAKDFKRILLYMKTINKYPMFFIDEFSHIKVMLDNNVINTSFLHILRQYSLEGLASFIFAGTYDIKELIRDPKYAITGQLVHTIEEQINEIDEKSAEELINVMEGRLTFTDEAVKHIHLLSGDVPYFIQIICKFCGYYAVEKNRSYLGKPEVEDVVKILTGEKEGERESWIKVLPKSIFQNNLYSPQD